MLARGAREKWFIFPILHIVLEVMHRLMLLEALRKGLISGGQLARKLKERPEIVKSPVRAAALPEQPQQPSNSAQQPQPRRLPVPSPPSWPCPAARTGGLPAADRAGPPRAWGASGTPWPGLRSVGRAGRPQARAPAGARWQGVGGRGRVGLREKWLYFSYTLVTTPLLYTVLDIEPLMWQHFENRRTRADSSHTSCDCKECQAWILHCLHRSRLSL